MPLARSRMEQGRKPPSLLDLCVLSAIDNLRYVGSVDGVEMALLERILPHCSLEQLTRIESCTEMDLTPITDPMWKLFYEKQFGEDAANCAIMRMKKRGTRFTWKNLFEAKEKCHEQAQNKMAENIRKRYQADEAAKKTKQIKICTKVPPSSKRSFFGGSGPSNLSNYKSPIMKKARMEVNSQAKMQAAIRRNTTSRTFQQTKTVSAHGQPMRMTTIRKPNSTITITKPTGSSRPFQGNKPKF